ncbi:MAG: NAD-dependent epimerase/dehydratase family protein, partial [Caldimicrobium sp.]
GDGTQTRSFCYVSDMVEGIYKAMMIGEKGEVYNLGSEEEYRILVPAKEGKPESYDYTVEFELWYFPFGKKDEFAQLWRKETKQVKFSQKEPY